MLRKYFLAKLFVPLIKGSVSPQFYTIFGKLNFWRNINRRGPYKNGENMYYLNLCWENIFWQKHLFHSFKEVFLHNFTISGKLNFWRNIDRRGPYKNGENLNYLKLCKELFFVKIICSTHQRKSFSTILHNFWKIEFLKEYRQARTLQKWWKFVLS